MTQNEIYNALYRGGAYSLPYLIQIAHPQQGVLYFVNNNEDVVYNGHTYTASNFKYTSPRVMGGVLKNGTLEITSIENEIVELVDGSDELFTVTAVGAINQGGDITPFKSYVHQYGTVTTDESMKIIFTFTNDDRLEMTFPPYVFDADNNPGNA